MLNAIVHRDYTSPVDVQIKVFDQNISIFNPGKLFGDITIEDLKTDTYQSHARNKLIAEAFYLTGDIEKYGSGFVRVRDEIRKYASMRFEYEEIGNGFLVSLSYAEQKTSIHIAKDVGKDVGKERVERIINVIKENNSITLKQLSALFDVTEKTIERDMAELKKANKIQRIGGRKEGYWKIML